MKSCFIDRRSIFCSMHALCAGLNHARQVRSDKIAKLQLPALNSSRIVGEGADTAWSTQSPFENPRMPSVQIAAGSIPVFSAAQMTAAKAEQKKSMTPYSMMVCFMVSLHI